MKSAKKKLAESKVAKPLAFPKITRSSPDAVGAVLEQPTCSWERQWRDLGLCDPAAQET
jgi:hypothetical protein